MKPTLTQIYKWFDEFNTLVFNGSLQRPPIIFSNTHRQLGQFFWGSSRGIGIKISLFYDRAEDCFRNTLLHEMCHLYCYKQGWIHEGHGPRWKMIAEKAYRFTGLNIQRTAVGETFVPAKENKAKMDAVKAKKNAPAILVDFDYGSFHFIVKTTKKVIWDASDGNEIKGAKNVSGVYICDNPRAVRWQNSRSLHRGYKFPNYQYNNEIAPMLKKSMKIDNLRKLCWWGEYDEMGIR